MNRRRRELTTDSSGKFFRQLGRKTELKSQPKFRLGSDRSRAELAYARLGALWDIVVAEHGKRRTTTNEMFRPPDKHEEDVPVWTADALTVADAIRKHQQVLTLPMPSTITDSTAYASYIDFMRDRFGSIIQILPEDEAAAAEGREVHLRHAEHRSRKARLAARIAEAPAPTDLVGATFHEAISAYASYMRDQRDKEFNRKEAEHAKRLQRAVADVDLGEVGYSKMEQLRDYWASRPEARLSNGKPAGRPISIETVKNHLATARRFVTWLDRSDRFDWELPRHGLDALRINPQRLKTAGEVAAGRRGVSVFNVKQLTAVYGHATDFERLLILLGLNAGWSHAEIVSFRWDDIENDVIRRIRPKTGVYGEWKMWDETQKALAWWRSVRPPDTDLVLRTQQGQPYSRQRIANTWANLKKRVERETGEEPAWWLSFKYLRKTAATLVRNASDGEVTGVFLCHRNAVVTDNLSDIYTNRPFAKVEISLANVREQIEPIFAAAPYAFTSERVGR